MVIEMVCVVLTAATSELADNAGPVRATPSKARLLPTTVRTITTSRQGRGQGLF